MKDVSDMPNASAPYEPDDGPVPKAMLDYIRATEPQDNFVATNSLLPGSCTQTRMPRELTGSLNTQLAQRARLSARL